MVYFVADVVRVLGYWVSMEGESVVVFDEDVERAVFGVLGVS